MYVMLLFVLSCRYFGTVASAMIKDKLKLISHNLSGFYHCESTFPCLHKIMPVISERLCRDLHNSKPALVKYI